jgi:hypothetical protein
VAGGVLVHNEDDSKYTSREARVTVIYGVYDKESGKLLYVGQSVQDLDDRLYQHLNNKEESVLAKRGHGEAPIATDGPRNPYRIERLYSSEEHLDADGQPRKWTPYEAAVWEQYFIDVYGGKDALLNQQDGITLEKFIQYRDMHNPC